MTPSKLTARTTRVVSSDEVGLAVYTYGGDSSAAAADAPTLICVHGYPDNSSVWDGVLAELGGHYRVVTYDVRGAGNSDTPDHRDAYRIDQLADDLAAVVNVVSPERPVHLLAHDWGSIQTWHALTGPALAGRIASFTSISGPSLHHAGAWVRAGLHLNLLRLNPLRLNPLRPSPLRPSLRRLRQVLVQLTHSYYIGFFQLPVLPELACRTGMLSRLVDAGERAGRGARARKSARPLADQINGLQLYRANMGPNVARPRAARTDVPVQVLAPTRDVYVTAALQIQAPAPWTTVLYTRSVEGGHWVVRSRPDVIARCTRDLVDHVEGGPQPRGLAVSRVTSLSRRRFEGQLVVVTGGGRGMGRETALRFAEQGAQVIVADINHEAAAETVRLARRSAMPASSYHLDVADGAAWERFAERVRAEHDVPDVVVNNAGIGMAGPFLATTDADWQRIIDINLWSVIHGSRCFGAQMVARGQGGRIVNIASAAAYAPSLTYPAYATTKAAVLMLTQCLRAELGGAGIGVIAVCPGFIDTDISRTTAHVGLSAAAQDKRREHAVASYGRRNYTPARAARHIVDATYRNRPLTTITAESKVFYAMSRFTPALARAVATVDLNTL